MCDARNCGEVVWRAEQRGSATPLLEIWGQAAVHPQDAPASLYYTDTRCVIMTGHNTPSATHRIPTGSTPVSITVFGGRRPDALGRGPGLMPDLKRLFRVSVQNWRPSCLHWQSCPNMCTSWWKAIPSTAFIGWGGPSKAVPRGGSARNIPGSSPGCPRAGPTPTLWRPWVVRHAKSARNTSSSSNGCRVIQRQLTLRLTAPQAQQRTNSNG